MENKTFISTDNAFNAGAISVIKRLTLRWLKDNNTHISMGFSATYLIYERERIKKIDLSFIVRKRIKILG